MLNNLILVGRVVRPITPLTNTLTIATQRSYKNTNGTYETDFFDIKLSHSLMSTAIDYLKEGDLVGVKGHIETEYSNFNEKGIKIICDKLTFLSSSKNNTNNMEEN